MAKMIPPYVYSGNPSPGEKEIFRRLKDDPDTSDWIVLHSLDIAEHIRKVAGEADFVVIVPQMGVLCLEVKANLKVQRKDGLWYYGNNPTPDSRGPFKQASQAMHSIRKQLITQDSSLASIVFWSAVIFPYTQFKITSGEWHHWQVIDTFQFRQRSISDSIIRVLNWARNHLSNNRAVWFKDNNKEPTKAQCGTISEILRPDFETYEPPHSRVNRLQQEVKKYTSEQFIALDAMSSNQRIIFTGPAGTGKTVLAIEACRRSVGQGNRVLLVCYNRLLGQHLQEQLEPLKPSVSVGTLHKHMIGVTQLENSEINSRPSFWTDDLPTLAIDRLLEACSEDYIFDEVIIDEAQDLLRSAYLDFIDLSLRGGLNAGKWKIFGDFDKQAIYGSHSDITFDELFTVRFENVPKYELRINCRNTPRIVSFIHLLGGLSPTYTRVLRPDDGVEPQITYYEDLRDQGSRLLQIIKHLKQEGFTNTDIVVLSTKAAEKSVVQSLTAADVRFTTFDKSSRKTIGSGSIHAFKGMESPAVIVTDVDSIAGEQVTSLFYVAITRSLHRLHILADKSVKKEVLRATLDS